MTDATQDYLESEDAMQNFFDDCCVIAKNEYDTFEHIWDGYVDWCEDCHEFIGTKKAFGQKLQDKNFKPDQAGTDRTRIYKGIRCIRENAKKLRAEAAKRSQEEAAQNASTTPPNHNNSSPPPLMPCTHCGRADGGVYQMNDLARATSFDPAWGTPKDHPNVYLHEACVQPFFAARSNGRGAPPKAKPARSPLTAGRARELYVVAIDWVAAQKAANIEFSTADLEAELRIIVREEVPLDEVEAAIAQVMALVFAV